MNVFIFICLVVVLLGGLGGLSYGVYRETRPSTVTSPESCTAFPSDQQLRQAGDGAVTISTEMDFLALTNLQMSNAVKIIAVCYDNTFGSAPETHGRVFFMSDKYDLHFQFARDVLRLSRNRFEFDRFTYFLPPQQRRIITATVERRGDTFVLSFWPSDQYSADEISYVYTRVKAAAPLMKDLVYVPGGRGQIQVLRESEKVFSDRGIVAKLSVDADTAGEQILNPGTTVGRLRVVRNSNVPVSLDENTVALFTGSVPPDLARVAGILSGLPQTQLSHTNVRARQNKIPNAFSKDVPMFVALDGIPVRYSAYRDTGVSLLAVSEAVLAEAVRKRNGGKEVNTTLRVPPASLDHIEPLLLTELSFEDSVIVGAKAANVGELHKVFGHPVYVPNGMALPFALYNMHMEQELSRAAVRALAVDDDDDDMDPEGINLMLGNEPWMTLWSLAQSAIQLQDALIACQRDGCNATGAMYNQTVLESISRGNDTTGLPFKLLRRVVQRQNVTARVEEVVERGLRRAIAARIWTEVPKTLRCRSSSSAEDLTGFSGAGLYDSFTHTFASEGPLSNTVKQVWASMWTDRAVSERRFARIDHMRVYMGVLVHLNFGTEQVNGVAVSANALGPLPYIQQVPVAFINAQFGEVSIVNPEVLANGELPIPESYTVSISWGSVYYESFSSLAPSPGATALTEAESKTLARYLEAVHFHFVPKYRAQEVCAFEIEFKVYNTSDGSRGGLAVKQVRPWAWGKDSCDFSTLDELNQREDFGDPLWPLSEDPPITVYERFALIALIAGMVCLTSLLCLTIVMFVLFRRMREEEEEIAVNAYLDSRRQDVVDELSESETPPAVPESDPRLMDDTIKPLPHWDAGTLMSLVDDGEYESPPPTPPRMSDDLSSMSITEESSESIEIVLPERLSPAKTVGGLYSKNASRKSRKAKNRTIK